MKSDILESLNTSEFTQTTMEELCKRSVQLQDISRSICAAMVKKLQLNTDVMLPNFIKTFLAKVENRWFTIEEYLPGKFVKYMDNKCNLVQLPEQFNENTLKISALTHFSFHAFHGNGILTDLQGVDLSLTDPEIASHFTHVDIDENDKDYLEGPRNNEGSQFLFGPGNLNSDAINNILINQCNKYCKLLNLSEVENPKMFEINDATE